MKRGLLFYLPRIFFYEPVYGAEMAIIHAARAITSQRSQIHTIGVNKRAVREGSGRASCPKNHLSTTTCWAWASTAAVIVQVVAVVVRGEMAIGYGGRTIISRGRMISYGEMAVVLVLNAHRGAGCDLAFSLDGAAGRLSQRPHPGQRRRRRPLAVWGV